MRLTRRQLERIELAKLMPGMAFLFLSVVPCPTCTTCGGTMAPIVDGKHMGQEFCDGRT